MLVLSRLEPLARLGVKPSGSEESDDNEGEDEIFHGIFLKE
jgi:hypothetical protein